MLPSIFGENLFDDFFTDPFGMMVMPQRHDPLYGKHSKNLMKTDVKETDKAYELDIDLPGFDKENVQIELNDGYLTINASTNEEKEDKDENGTFLRKERFVGSCRRSFYVGDDVSEDDITAKFENGILSINVPKKELPKPEDRKRLISID